MKMFKRFVLVGLDLIPQIIGCLSFLLAVVIAFGLYALKEYNKPIFILIVALFAISGLSWLLDYVVFRIRTVYRLSKLPFTEEEVAALNLDYWQYMHYLIVNYIIPSNLVNHLFQFLAVPCKFVIIVCTAWVPDETAILINFKVNRYVYDSTSVSLSNILSVASKYYATEYISDTYFIGACWWFAKYCDDITEEAVIKRKDLLFKHPSDIR